MSVAACRSSAASGFESILALPAALAAAPTINSWLLSETPNYASKHDQEAEKPPGQFDIWSSIQAQKPKEQLQPYVHPLMRRSSSLLSQKSLEICTESLGSETGSDDFFTDFPSPKEEESEQTPEPEPEQELDYFETVRRKEAAATVNYHCSVGRRSSPPRSFPPPLPSISRRDGPCLQMRPHRRDGRLVVEAVPVPSQNYLQAERQGGRLLLSFINTAPSAVDNAIMEKNPVLTEEIEEEEIMEAEEYQEEEEDEEEEEEEVEVVDRGTVVEVKVSMQPQQSGGGGGGGAATMKVHRSSIVINKFVSCMSISDNHAATEEETESPPVRRLSTATTTTAAVAAVAASSLSAAADGSHSSATDNKLLFTSRRRNREELLHDMRRCSQLRKPLFIWEPCCIATSS